MKLISFVKYPLIALAACFIFSCQDCAQHPPPAFYYWKQSFELTKEQRHMLAENNTKRLYVRFFDVIIGQNGQASPTSKIDFKEPIDLEIVPCIYIQNAVFNQTKDVNSLAQRVNKLIFEIANKQHLKIREIQIDCDWTPSTREAYFEFLKALKTQQKAGIELVSTIRLHQIKYASTTGVPPVNKGLLMCYNMDDIEDVTTPNSIISTKVLGQYVNENTSYPLKLDLALPMYQWGLVFRLGKFAIISNDLSEENLQQDAIKKIDNVLYSVDSNVSINETSLCKGDLIRFETSKPDELVLAAELLKKTKLKFEQIIYYHISHTHTNNYDKSLFSKINSIIP